MGPPLAPTPRTNDRYSSSGGGASAGALATEAAGAAAGATAGSWAVDTADSITFGTVDWHGLMLMFASDHGPVVGEFAPQTQAMPSQFASVTRQRDQFATMPIYKWSQLLNIVMDKEKAVPKKFGIRYNDNNPKAKLLLAEIQQNSRVKRWINTWKTSVGSVAWMTTRDTSRTSEWQSG